MIDRTSLSLVPGVIRFLPSFVKLVVRLLRDRRVPFYLKLIPWSAVVYLLFPFDLLPEALIPLLGWVEDLVVLVLACWLFLRLSPKEVVMEHGRQIGWEDRRHP